MAIKVKSSENVAQKWQNRASGSVQAYTDGISNPKQDQLQATVAAAPIWAAGIQQAIANGSFVKGVEKVGATKWKNNSLAKGAQRFPAGVASGMPDYQKGVQPYLNVIASLDLPPRLPKGNPANLQRVAKIAEALRAQKLGG